MSLYAYCVTRLEKDETWEVFGGVADRPVFALRYQKIALLASRVDRVRLEEPRFVVQHGQVVHRIFEQRTVLPFRFGTHFASEEQAMAVLRQNHDSFSEALRRLRGKAEMHVKVQMPGERASANVLAGQITSHLKLALGAHDEQACLRELNGHVLVDLHYLVERQENKASVELPRFPQCQLQISGPWPPYHFLPVMAKLPTRAERLSVLPGRQPLRARAARA